jgi:hypothetical protein
MSLLLILCVFLSTPVSSIHLQRRSRPVKQPAEVVEAYRVIERFQQLLGEHLDFSSAYDATFPSNMARRRAIAIRDGEFGDVDFAEVDDATLINAYKSRMQIVYLILPLASPANTEEEGLFFPPDIKEIFDRKAPHTAQEFRLYSLRLEEDARRFRAHIEQLAARYPAVQERLIRFKSEILSAKVRPPKSSVVKQLHYIGGGDVLSKDEPYYEIDGYTVVREAGKMRIAGIRFFTRLF